MSSKLLLLVSNLRMEISLFESKGTSRKNYLLHGLSVHGIVNFQVWQEVGCGESLKVSPHRAGP